MVTGASTCDLAIVMVDARYGIQTQTRRHSYICSLLGIQHIIVAINKMDLKNYDRTIYEKIENDYREMAQSFDIKDLHFVPISALKGDNVVSASESMEWYKGPTLMHLLETVSVTQDEDFEHMRFPVQYVNRPNLNFRGFCGTLASGIVKAGDDITVLPSGKKSKVKTLYTFDGDLDCAHPNQAITITLEDEVDVSRGDMLVHSGFEPSLTNQLEAHVVWMDETKMETGKEYIFKFATKSCTGNFSDIVHKVDVNTLKQSSKSAKSLQLNEIALTSISLTDIVPVDVYQNLAQTGAFVVIDRLSNVTVGAGMTSSISEADSSRLRAYTEVEKDLNAYIRKHFPEWGCTEI